MNIRKKEESREPCMEAGWYAYDYELERPVCREDILKLKGLGGDFIYLSGLKEPFYKLECHYMMVKGVEGRSTLRLAVYREYEEESSRKVEQFLEGLP